MYYIMRFQDIYDTATHINRLSLFFLPVTVLSVTITAYLIPAIAVRRLLPSWSQYKVK